MESMLAKLMLSCLFEITKPSIFCNLCERSFKYKTNFKAHLTTHTGERPYQYNVCEKSFSQSLYFKNHMRIHTGERNYQCEVCEKSFTQTSNLKTHMITPSEKQPY
ncbi:unnamed protein product [Clavelina lepadiformis]|uniref:C2H2-type domain-containing protein n=1 Tax=Clavelina lepadiformis TaxID=159417 RepID=A0ABP0GII0_CLALP